MPAKARSTKNVKKIADSDANTSVDTPVKKTRKPKAKKIVDTVADTDDANTVVKKTRKPKAKKIDDTDDVNTVVSTDVDTHASTVVDTPTSPDSLTSRIQIAIATKDTAALYSYKDICDRLHAGVSPVQSYTIEYLPPDSIYEQMIQTIKQLQSFIEAITARGMQNATITKDGKQVNNNKISPSILLPELWMGSLPKRPDIIGYESAILLPKFDGCSCGVKYERELELRPTKASTRGQDAAFHKQTSNILEKYLSISKPITDALNSDEAAAFTFNADASGEQAGLFDTSVNEPLPFEFVHSLQLRGEIVIKDKSRITSAPAAYVAGKLNGGIEVWNKSVDTVEFQPYEIMKLTFKLPTTTVVSTKSNPLDEDPTRLVDYVPRQGEVIEFFQLIGLIPYAPMYDNLAVENSINIVVDYYHRLLESIPQPIDGVVYCSVDWTYPQTKDKKTDANYDKYAWKPQSELTSVLRSVDYSIARDGKIGLILNYDPVEINGKKYARAKTAPTRMVGALDGIAIGDVITVELCNDISPQVKCFVENVALPKYALPAKCPFCGSKVKKNSSKTSTTITCTNKNCSEIMIQKFINFLKIAGVKGIAEAKLKKLVKDDELSLFKIHENYAKGNELIDAIKAMTLTKYLGSIGFGSNKKISDYCAANDMNGMNPIDLYIEQLDAIDTKMSDTFVHDVIDFTKAIYE